MEEMLIVPTQELLFAIKKDGTVIDNISQKDLKPDYHAVIALFYGVKTFINTCDEAVFLAYALASVFKEPELHDAILKRMGEMKKDK